MLPSETACTLHIQPNLWQVRLHRIDGDKALLEIHINSCVVKLCLTSCSEVTRRLMSLYPLICINSFKWDSITIDYIADHVRVFQIKIIGSLKISNHWRLGITFSKDASTDRFHQPCPSTPKVCYPNDYPPLWPEQQEPLVSSNLTPQGSHW